MQLFTKVYVFRTPDFATNKQHDSAPLSRENRGLNVIDIQNKITTQRIKWLFDQFKLDSEDFTKVVANKVMGKFNAGYEGVDIFKAHITEMNPNPQITSIDMQSMLSTKLK